MALVIKSWYANTVPDPFGNYVSIVGREEGVLSYLLAAVGIDATTRFRVDARSVYIERGSLAGFEERVIPLTKISSSYFSFEKPWREAIVLGVVLLSFFGLGLIVGPLYYFLNKKLGLGVVEVGSIVSGIHFKRSLIEGQEINENEGRRLVGIVRELVMQAAGSSQLPQQPSAMMVQQQPPQQYQQQQYPGYMPPR